MNTAICITEYVESSMTYDDVLCTMSAISECLMADDDDNSCPEPELGGKTILLSPVNTNDAISFSTFFLEASFRIYRVRHLNFD